MLAKIVRLPLRLLPEGRVVTILGGTLKGRKWVLGSGPHACWLGIGEVEKQELFQKAVKPGDVIYDLGANVGHYAMYAASLVGPTGKVIAFEPSPRNVKFLRQHLALNSLSNVEVIEAAAADYDGEASFDVDVDPVAQRMDEKGTAKVRVVRLDSLYASGVVPKPDVIKINIEGAEMKALQGAKTLIAEARPAMFVGTHNQFVPGIHEQCLEFFRSMGCEVVEFGSGKTPTEIYASFPE